jgi:PAS domain S-box-containing protein
MMESCSLLQSFFALFLPLAGLVIVVAFIGGNLRIDSHLDSMVTEEIVHVRLGAAELVDELDAPIRHLMSLPKEGPIRAGIDDPSPDKRAGLAAAFLSLLLHNPAYDQARWIDQNGRELVRVDKSKGGSEPEIVPESRLQDKAGSYYFADSVVLGAGEIFISPLDLNIENGGVESPYKPMLRVATPVTDRAGNRRGILILNVLGAPILADFARIASRGGDKIMLLNRKGYWLYPPDSTEPWGFMLGHPDGLGNRYPLAWARIRGVPSGHFFDDDGLWTWETIEAESTDLAGLSKTGEPYWVTLSHRPAQAIRAVYYGVWLPTALIAIPLLLIFAGLSWLVTVRSKLRQDALIARAAAETVAEESRRRVVELEEAHKSSATLAAIVESSDDAIIGKTLDGIITSWNRGAERVFGYRADEALGHAMMMLFPSRLEQEERNILERVGHGETIRHFDTVRRCRNGREIDVSVTISPIRDGAGRIIGASKIARDVSERKRATAELERHREHLEDLVGERTAQIVATNERLREREKLLTTVTDNLPGIVGYWDRDLHCRFANRAYIEWFGRRPEEMADITIRTLLGK